MGGGPILGISIITLMNKTVVGMDWVYGIILLFVILICWVAIPQQSLQSKNIKYKFPNNDYFDRFLN